MVPDKLWGVSFPSSHWEHVRRGEVHNSTRSWMWSLMELQADKSIQAVVGAIWSVCQCDSHLHLSIKMDF